MKKGFVLTFDALFAGVLIMMVFMIAFGVQIQSIQNSEKTDFKKIHYAAEDALEVMNKKGVLDNIGMEWAEANEDKNSPHYKNASAIAGKYLSQILPDIMGYKLLVDNDTIYEHVPMRQGKYVTESLADSETRSLRVLTGYGAGKPNIGFIARAFLVGTRVERQTALSGWQRTTSPGQLDNHLKMTTRFQLANDYIPSRCNEAHLQALSRMLPNEEFNLWINGRQVCVPEGSTQCNFTPLNLVKTSSPDLCNYLKGGENTMTFEVWDQHETYEIGKGSGTRLVVDYNTSGMSFNVTKKFYVDAVESNCVVKQQMTLLMPGEIRSMDVHLKLEGVEKVALALIHKSQIIPISRKDVVGGVVEFSDAEIRTEIAKDPYFREYTDLQDRDFSLNIYLDTWPETQNPFRSGYETQGKTPDCDVYRLRKILPESYVIVDYSPYPEGTDIYGYNVMSTPVNLAVPSGAANCVGDYTDTLQGEYTLPVSCLPWTTDIWIAWTSSGVTDSKQLITANGIPLLDHPEGAVNPPFEKYMVRFGYSNPNKAVMTVMKPGANVFSATGQEDPLHQFCFSKSLTSGVVTFLFRAFVDYGDVFRYGDGCKLTVNFEDGSSITVGNSSTVCDQNEFDNDAAADAMKRLLAQMDFNADNKTDVKFDSNQMQVENSVQTRIRSMWGPAIFKLVVWI